MQFLLMTTTEQRLGLPVHKLHVNSCFGRVDSVQVWDDRSVHDVERAPLLMVSVPRRDEEYAIDAKLRLNNFPNGVYNAGAYVEVVFQAKAVYVRVITYDPNFPSFRRVEHTLLETRVNIPGKKGKHCSNRSNSASVSSKAD